MTGSRPLKPDSVLAEGRRCALTASQGPSTIRRMDAELSKLENQIEQMIGLYEAGRTESRELRARVVRLEGENRLLAEKVKLATAKLESLLAQLPEA